MERRPYPQKYNNIEVVDLSDGALVKTLRTNGIVVLKGALPPEEHAKAMQSVRKLFSLPKETKQAYSSTEPFSPGFGAFGRSRARDTGVPNSLESWDISLEGPDGIPPEANECWRPIVALNNRLRSIVEQTLSTIEAELNTDGLLNLLTTDRRGIHLLHYPAELARTHPKSRRQSTHYDVSLLTALPAASQPGLAAQLGGKMRPIQVGTCDVVIQAGLALQLVTGGHIPASLHTVETEPKNPIDRDAIVFFGVPQRNIVLRNLMPDRDALPSEGVKVEDFERDYFSGIFPAHIKPVGLSLD